MRFMSSVVLDCINRSGVTSLGFTISSELHCYIRCTIPGVAESILQSFIRCQAMSGVRYQFFGKGFPTRLAGVCAFQWF